MTDSENKQSAEGSGGAKTRARRSALIAPALILISTSAIFANSTFSKLKAASAHETWSKTQASVVECINERKGVFPTATPKDSQVVTCQFATAGRIVRTTFHSEGWNYHKGDSVEIQFDPFAPNNSALAPRGGAGDVIAHSLAFAACFILGFAFLFLALQKENEKLGIK